MAAVEIAAVWMKKGLEVDLRASSRSASKPFFGLLRKPGRLCRPDCRFGVVGVASAVSLRRNERGRCSAPQSA